MARRRRRTQAEIEYISEQIYRIAEAFRPITVRQMFYQLVVAGIIDKTEKEYKNTVCRLLKNLRMTGSIPFDWIADNTRWMRKPETYHSLRSMLQSQHHFYRRAVWDNQNAYVEVWLEKEALAGVLLDATDEWDVPLMVTRGYPSLSFLHSAGESINRQEKPVYLYYFGDHDPSGKDITRFVEQTIRKFAPTTEIFFKCVAVTEQQIIDYKLPTRPTKTSDSRSKSFVGDSVEVDAIHPDELRNICRFHIEQHVNSYELSKTQDIERAEKETLQLILESTDFNGLAP